jgi:tetratricopeptide (TPR) repeat protein
MELATAADDPATILGDIVEAPWVPLQQRAPVYRFILQAKKDAVTKSEGLQKESSQQVLTLWQLRWIKYLVETRQYVEAADAIDKMSRGKPSADSPAVASLELRVFAKTGTIDSVLARYRADPLNAPPSEVLRSAARQLLESGDRQSASKILEFVFARDIEDHKMIAVNFLGLAEIRIAQGDLPGAVGLLRRLVVVVGNPFENLEAAATLLEKTGHNPEAIEFLDELVKSAPWEPAYRVRLARAKISGRDPALAQNDLVAIASATTVPYRLRVAAAVALLGGNRSSEIGSAELNLLAATDKSATSAADRPFFYDARLKAAEESSDLQVKIKLLGNALADTPSRDDARLPLFLAAASARSDQFARAIIQPLLRQGFLNSVPAPAETGSDPMGDVNYPADTQPDGSSISFSPPANVQQKQAAKALGNLLARLGRLDEASRYLRIALQLEDTAGGRKQFKTSIAELNARLRRQRLNSQRQPILHEALEQDRLVRPRLLARPIPARISPAKAGPKS